MTRTIEVYSAGGGIVLAETHIDPTHCAIVSTDAPDHLSIYNLVGVDVPFLPEDMVLSAKHDELSPELQELHAEMVEALRAKA